MKFTDGFWLKRHGMNVLHPRALQEVSCDGDVLTAWAITKPFARRGDEVGVPMLTLSARAIAPDVVAVRLERYRGTPTPTPQFELAAPTAADVHVESDGRSGLLRTGDLEVRVGGTDGLDMEFIADGRVLTRASGHAYGHVTTSQGETYVHQQLVLGVGETVYGLGERFGPVAKNGQSVEMWNADGGTATEQAYKNVPFYLTSGGYGVFVNHPEHVSYEVGSEINTRVQFSVPGESLEYYVIYGPPPKEILAKYTQLTGRPPQLPAWSYGLWLSTSFTTDYSEGTVNGFVDEMEARGLPLSVVHFDCYWMRPSHWCDFTWDPEMFPDPEAMLARLHDKGLKVCVWINPYIAQRSSLFQEGMERGYLLRRDDGSVRQWDYWQSGMAWVDFTNPDAVRWWKEHLRRVIRQGVDAVKTDFGERVPTDVVWHDGSDPQRMHNYYTHLYNRAAYEVIAEERGADQALVFARSATAGGQIFPVHWGGDSEPTLESMGETLRGGLSLGLSGFGYWSHDMGGFEGTPDPEVFDRWFPFGMLSSHSRLHGSRSYRVPWNYGEESVEIARRFIALKNRLMPYLLTHARDVTEAGTPLLRHMILEYSDDPGSRHVDTQYLLGPDLLVAPVFRRGGEVDVYLPSSGWTDVLSGAHITDRGWHHQVHPRTSLPLLVPDGTVLPVGPQPSSPEHDVLDDLTLYVASPYEGCETVCTVDDGRGRSATFSARVSGGVLEVSCDRDDLTWSVAVIGAAEVDGDSSRALPGYPEVTDTLRWPAPAGEPHRLRIQPTSTDTTSQTRK